MSRIGSLRQWVKELTCRIFGHSFPPSESLLDILTLARICSRCGYVLFPSDHPLIPDKIYALLYNEEVRKHDPHL